MTTAPAQTEAPSSIEPAGRGSSSGAVDRAESFAGLPITAASWITQPSPIRVPEWITTLPPSSTPSPSSDAVAQQQAGREPGGTQPGRLSMEGAHRPSPPGRRGRRRPGPAAIPRSRARPGAPRARGRPGRRPSRRCAVAPPSAGSSRKCSHSRRSGSSPGTAGLQTSPDRVVNSPRSPPDGSKPLSQMVSFRSGRHVVERRHPLGADDGDLPHLVRIEPGEMQVGGKAGVEADVREDDVLDPVADEGLAARRDLDSGSRPPAREAPRRRARPGSRARSRPPAACPG